MKVAYIASYDFTSRNHWSGLGYFIWNSIRSSGCDVEGYISNTSALENSILQLRNRIFHRVDRGRYMSFHDPLRVWFKSRRITNWLTEQKNIDIVFSPGTLEIAYLNSKIPMVSWSDATFHSLSSTYPDYADLSKRGRIHGDKIEKAFLNKCSKVLYASNWAANDAITYYKANPKKVHIVPFGPNFDFLPDSNELSKQCDHRFLQKRFLFIGVDWVRKGGDFVIKVLTYLRLRDNSIKLTLVGAKPPREVLELPWVEYLGFIDKDTETGQAQLREVFSRSFALFVPSIAECYGLVYCEAFAFGCPAIAKNVGGVSTIIKHNHSGLLVDTETTVESCAEKILPILEDTDLYTSMARNARDAFENKFNWECAGNRVVSILKETSKTIY